MPRLILQDDDGRELFAGQVSQQNVEIVAGFLRRNMATLQSLAAFKKTLEGFGEIFGPLLGDAPPPRRPPPLRPSARPRGGRR